MGMFVEGTRRMDSTCAHLNVELVLIVQLLSVRGPDKQLAAAQQLCIFRRIHAFQLNQPHLVALYNSISLASVL